MYQSKNCGHGFNLFIKGIVTNDKKEFVPCLHEYKPVYCPICGKKVEEVENDRS